MPALAKHIAMPPPMVPAPITAARLISRAFVPSGRVSLAASRSAKKICRCAFASGLTTSSWNMARSRERLGERQVEGVADGFDRRRRGAQALGALDMGGGELLEFGAVAPRGA